MTATTKRVPPTDTPPFRIRRSGIQGKGGFATRHIRAGERIIEYVGERISWREADRRYDDGSMKRHHTFLFAVTQRTVIDAAVNGNDARFINHSCDPNCEAIQEDKRIFIDAVRDITTGEELTYDYAYTRDKSHTAEDEALYACRCGSPKCRGTLLEPRKAKREPLPESHHAAARHPHDTATEGERAQSDRGRHLSRSGGSSRERRVSRA